MRHQQHATPRPPTTSLRHHRRWPLRALPRALGAVGIAASAAGRRRVPLHDLRPGAHRLAVTYRPDTDEPLMPATASFTVRPAAADFPVAPLATGASVALVTLVAAATAWPTRRRLPVGAAR